MPTTGWWVTVDIGDAGEPEGAIGRGDQTALDGIGELSASLAPVHGVVAGHAGGWSATVTVDAADRARRPGATAVERVLAAGRACELPTAPLVRVEVVREDVRDAELDQLRPGRARLRSESRRHPRGEQTPRVPASHPPP